MNIAFGPFNYEREPVQKVRCVTADLLHDKYGVTATPGKTLVALITAHRVTDLVHPNSLRSCLENLTHCINTRSDRLLPYH